MKDVIILRSVSGAGKTTAAEMIRAGREDWVICCADDYFMVDGVYKFNPEKLRAAHIYCQTMFQKALYAPEIKGIIVANTNTKERDFSFYEDEAKAEGARVFFFVVENRHGGKDVHNVPEEALQRQEDGIKKSLKLR